MLSMNFSDSYHVFHSTHFWIRELYAEWKKHYRSGWQDKGPEKWSVWTHQSTWWHCSRAIGLFHHQWLPPSRTRVGSDHTGDSQEQTSAWKFPHGKCILTWKWPPGHLPWLRKTMVFPETLIPALERMYHLYLTSTRSCLSGDSVISQKLDWEWASYKQHDSGHRLPCSLRLQYVIQYSYCLE